MSVDDSQLDVLRSLDHSGSVFHLSGKKSLQGYNVQLTLTDFQGSAWTAIFSLQDVLDSLEAYEPNDEQLLSWLQAAYSSTQPSIVKEDGRLARIEAFHHEQGARVRLRLPPGRAFEEVSGEAALNQYQRLAALLCEKCESASGRAQESSQEVDRLSAELAAEKERSDKLRSKLLELQPGMRITASGSLKRSQETPLSSQAAPGAMEASQAQQPEASATANGSSVGGLHTELGSPSPQSKATGAGKAKVIRGRGPGRHGGRLPGRGRRGH
ncbi:g2743 [Coccomyxa viridis]|uniref:G2743 protein n=1 Tax=Coccomyxa viridis TaxID=1274662 RepID=A0ABP1FT87_9CHLO